jgi:hypothetical protein
LSPAAAAEAAEAARPRRRSRRRNTRTAKLAANGDKGKALLDKMVDQIDSLQPPDAVKTQAQSFLDGVKKEASLFGDLTQAAKDGDTAKIKDIDGKLASDAAATSEDARFIGATGCARLLS